MKLTANEYSIVITALKELKKIELKEAETFAGFGNSGLAAECRASAAETDAVLKKLIDNVRKNVVKEKS